MARTSNAGPGRPKAGRARALLRRGLACTAIAALLLLIYVLPVTAYLSGLCLALLLWMLRQYVTREHELLTLRNIFLLGFILFELYSVANVVSSGNFGQFPLNHP